METKTIQFSAGKGAPETTFVLAKVLKICLKELKNHSIDYQILHKENGSENGTIQSVTLQLKGHQLDAFLKSWIGTIQWIGTSSFRPNHKRKNWFIACFELEKSEMMELKESEIQFQAIRSSGPGGQHVNKVSSAVRAKHKPTGVQVLVMDSRSQHRNKKLAIERLQEKVAEFNLNQTKKQLKDQWKNHQALERGNPIRTFKGTDFKSVKNNKSYKKTRHQLKNDLRKL